MCGPINLPSKSVASLGEGVCGPISLALILFLSDENKDFVKNSISIEYRVLAQVMVLTPPASTQGVVSKDLVVNVTVMVLML